MDEAEIGIVGVEHGQSRLELAARDFRIGRPTVFPAGEVRPDVNLQHRALALSPQGARIALEGAGFACHEVEEVDAFVKRRAHDALDLGVVGFMDAPHAQADYADPIAAVRQDAVLHGYVLSFSLVEQE